MSLRFIIRRGVKTQRHRLYRLQLQVNLITNQVKPRTKQVCKIVIRVCRVCLSAFMYHLYKSDSKMQTHKLCQWLGQSPQSFQVIIILLVKRRLTDCLMGQVKSVVCIVCKSRFSTTPLKMSNIEKSQTLEPYLEVFGVLVTRNLISCILKRIWRDLPKQRKGLTHLAGPRHLVRPNLHHPPTLVQWLDSTMLLMSLSGYT